MALTTGKILTNETVSTIYKFKTGELKPISTGIDHLDESLLGGLLPGTVLGIVGRSSHGKSYDMERIQRHILDNEEDVIFVSCNWELSHFKLLIRDICQRTGKNQREVLFDPLTEESTLELKTICDKHRTENVLFQNEPVNPEVFAEDIEQVIADHPTKKIIVAVDNLENILISKGSQKESMDALLYQVNRLKNLHSYISFIVLNQMNNDYVRRMDDPKRQKPIESDIYGSDQLYKLCDVLYIKMIPWKLGIRDRFMVFGPDMYPWLEEFKIYSDGKTAGFEPFGCAYYFYLKLRAVADEKNIKDIYVDRMFKRDETSLPIESYKINTANNTPPPTFDMTTIMHNTSAMTSAQGVGFDDVPTIEDEEAPF
jgi:KaiC/GvpD/RAD55 family RecA-like ATPase